MATSGSCGIWEAKGYLGESLCRSLCFRVCLCCNLSRRKEEVCPPKQSHEDTDYFLLRSSSITHNPLSRPAPQGVSGVSPGDPEP